MLQQGLILVQHLGQQHGEVSDQPLVNGVLTDDVEPAKLLIIHLQIETGHRIEIAGPAGAPGGVDRHGVIFEAGQPDVIDMLVGCRPVQQLDEGAGAERCCVQLLGSAVEEGEGVVGLLQLGGFLLHLVLELPIELAQFVGHGDKGARQLPQLVFTVAGQLQIEILALDLASTIDQLIERGDHLLAGKAHGKPGDEDDGEQTEPLSQCQHPYLELDVVLHLIDEIVDGGHKLLGVVGVASGGAVFDVLTHLLPLIEHLAIGAAQGGRSDPALGLLQLCGVQRLFKLGEAAQYTLAPLDFVSHPVSLHPQRTGEVDRLGIGYRVEEGDHGNDRNKAGHEEDQYHGAPDGAADRMDSESVSHAHVDIDL